MPFTPHIVAENNPVTIFVPIDEDFLYPTSDGEYGQYTFSQAEISLKLLLNKAGINHYRLTPSQEYEYDDEYDKDHVIDGINVTFNNPEDRYSFAYSLYKNDYLNKNDAHEITVKSHHNNPIEKMDEAFTFLMDSFNEVAPAEAVSFSFENEHIAFYFPTTHSYVLGNREINKLIQKDPKYSKTP